MCISPKFIEYSKAVKALKRNQVDWADEGIAAWAIEHRACIGPNDARKLVRPVSPLKNCAMSAYHYIIRARKWWVGRTYATRCTLISYL